jgi:hypothetical protein
LRGIKGADLMAHVQWCVGNTTLREAARLKDGLRVLKDNFDGKPWSYENQKRFLELLYREGIYELGEGKSAQQIEQHGRIWSSTFNELRFATCYKKGNKYVPGGARVTKAGEALLSDDYVDEDVWLRQLLKIQLPNPLPQKSKSQYLGFNLLPFQSTLRIIKECNGISKDEGFIVNTLRAMADVDTAIRLIKEYREGLNKVRKDGRNAVRKYIIQRQCNMAKLLYGDEIKERLKYLRSYYKSNARAKNKELLNAIVKGGKGSTTAPAIRAANKLGDLKRQKVDFKELEKCFLGYYLILKSGSWKDYIDATARYFRMSGIFTIHRSRITTADTHKEIAEWILSIDWQLKKNGDYLDYLHDYTLPALPQDKIKYLRQKTKQTLKDVIYLSRVAEVQVKPKVVKIDKKITDPLLLRRKLLRLSETRRELREYEYMMQLHRKTSAVDEIIDYFDSIKHKEILGYAPTHFEWNVWRGFLAIDKLSKFPHECRNFDVDDDLQPRSNAPGGRPDMVFYYKDYVLVVEVTLSSGETQYNTEHEPVPRHVVRVMEQEKGRDVYSLFIAPQIHINTAIHFYAKMTSVPHITSSKEKVYPKIIPLSLEEYILLLRIFQKQRYSPADLKGLLQDIIALKANSDITDGSQWLTYIKGCIEKWSGKL